MEKKSFILYNDLIHQVEALTGEQAGELFKSILRHVNGIDGYIEDQTVNVIMIGITNTLKRDHEKYKARCIKNKENAIKRWHDKDANACDRMQMDAKHADSDTDNDIDTDLTSITCEQFPF